MAKPYNQTGIGFTAQLATAGKPDGPYKGSFDPFHWEGDSVTAEEREWIRGAMDQFEVWEAAGVRALMLREPRTDGFAFYHQCRVLEVSNG